MAERPQIEEQSNQPTADTQPEIPTEESLKPELKEKNKPLEPSEVLRVLGLENKEDLSWGDIDKALLAPNKYSDADQKVVDRFLNSMNESLSSNESENGERELESFIENFFNLKNKSEKKADAEERPSTRRSKRRTRKPKTPEDGGLVLNEELPKAIPLTEEQAKEAMEEEASSGKKMPEAIIPSSKTTIGLNGPETEKIKKSSFADLAEKLKELSGKIKKEREGDPKAYKELLEERRELSKNMAVLYKENTGKDLLSESEKEAIEELKKKKMRVINVKEGREELFAKYVKTLEEGRRERSEKNFWAAINTKEKKRFSVDKDGGKPDPDKIQKYFKEEREKLHISEGAFNALINEGWDVDNTKLRGSLKKKIGMSEVRIQHENESVRYFKTIDEFREWAESKAKRLNEKAGELADKKVENGKKIWRDTKDKYVKDLVNKAIELEKTRQIENANKLTDFGGVSLSLQEREGIGSARSIIYDFFEKGNTKKDDLEKLKKTLEGEDSPLRSITNKKLKIKVSKLLSAEIRDKLKNKGFEHAEKDRAELKENKGIDIPQDVFHYLIKEGFEPQNAEKKKHMAPKGEDQIVIPLKDGGDLIIPLSDFEKIKDKKDIELALETATKKGRHRSVNRRTKSNGDENKTFGFAQHLKNKG